MGEHVAGGNVRDPKTKANNRNRGTLWASIIGGLISGVILIYVVTYIVPGIADLARHLLVSNIPLQALYSYDFEGALSPAPWKSYPLEKKSPLEISDERARSGKQSLRLTVNLESNGDASIGTTELDQHKVKAIVAWVLVPESAQVRDRTLRSYIQAYLESPSNKNEPIWAYSEKERLIPGVWTPILLGIFYGGTYEKFSFSADGTINTLEIWIVSEDAYSGPVYVDDITIYTDAAH